MDISTYYGYTVRRLILILFISLLGAACSGGGEEASDIRDQSVPIDPESIVYANVPNLTEAYDIEMPSNWLHMPISGLSDDIQVLTAYHELRKDEQDLYLENFILLKGDLIQTSPLPIGISSLEILSTDQETIGHHQVEIEIGKYHYDPTTGPGITLGYMSILIPANGTYYGLQYTGEYKRFNTYKDVAKKIVESWVIGVVIENDVPYIANSSQEFDKANIDTDGDNYLVTYCIPKTRDSFSLKAKLISSQGLILRSLMIADDVPKYFRKDCVSASPKVVFDGVNYLVTYTEDSTINTYTGSTLYAKRINKQGDILDNTPLNLATFKNHLNQNSHDLAFDGNRSILVWYDRLEFEDADPSRRLFSKFLEPDGTVTDRLTIHEFSERNRNPVSPSLTIGPETIMISWQELATQYELMELNFDGNVLSHLVVNPSWEYRPFHKPHVIAGESEFLLSWSKASNIYAYRIDGGEVVSDSASDIPLTLYSISDGPAYLLNATTLDEDFEFIFQKNYGIHSVLINQNLTQTGNETNIHPGPMQASIDPVYVNKSVIEEDKKFTITTLENGTVIGWF